MPITHEEKPVTKTARTDQQDQAAILAAQGLTRCFAEITAVNNVSLSVKRGSLTGLIGPNGAGKTTLFNVLTGAMKPDAGSVHLLGQDVTGAAPNRLFALGLARTFQIPRPFARMSVLENTMLAPLAQVGETVAGPFFFRNRVARQEQQIRAKALEILDFVTLADLADHPAGQISGGQMKLLELARVLMGDPQLILLDEPAAGVNPVLTETLTDKIHALNAQGTTFVVIEHNMDLVMRHCDPIIALAEGQVIFEGTSREAMAHPQLLDAYLGAAPDV